MQKRTPILLLSIVFLLLAPATAVAQHEEGEHAHHGEAAHGEDAHGEMDPEMQAMMEAWHKAAIPGEQHAVLAELAGVWKATVKSFMEPGGEPMVTEGSFRREMILGGRVMSEEYEGSFQGQPFLGHGLIGYDNVTGRWWSTWTDNMSTGLMVAWGEWSEEEGAVVYHGKTPDPMTGEMVKTKHVVRHLDDGSEVMEMYDLRSGEPVKTMEIVSTRQ